jgi:RNA polymerase sigma-70 factor, ECF subfamily
MHESLAAAVPFRKAMNEEDALVVAAREDPAAFGLLYQRYRDRIYWYLQTRTGSPEDAADLVQQVFLRALSALAQYQPRKGPFAAWLFGIARNLAATHHRRLRPTVTWDLVPEAFRVDGSDTEAEVLRREDLTRLRTLFYALDANRRELLVLRFVAGLTTPEIAVVIGKSPAATKKQMSRTLHSLKEHYRE